MRLKQHDAFKYGDPQLSRQIRIHRGKFKLITGNSNSPRRSPHMTSVQYCGGCSVHRDITSVLEGIASVMWCLLSTVRDGFSTMVDNISTCRGITSVLWGYISTMEGIQYCGGHLQYCWEITAVHVRESFKTVWETFSAVELFNRVGDRIRVQWGIASLLYTVFSTLGDNFSTVGYPQYCGRYHQYCGGCSDKTFQKIFKYILNLFQKLIALRKHIDHTAGLKC